MKRALTAAIIVAFMPSPTYAQARGGEPVEIPLRMHAGRLVVPVEAPDGERMEFLLSTGNAVTVFSQSVAARFGNAPSLELGGVPIPTDGSRTIPDASLTFDGKAFGGIVGPTALNEFDVLIDVPGQRLVLKPFGTAVAWEGVTLSDPIRLRVYHGVVLALDVEFNGRPYGAMLDIGTPTLVVNDRVQRETQINQADTGTLGIGGTTHANVPVRVLDLDVFHRFVPNGDGFVLVGAAIARECAISISWIHRELRTCVR